MTTKKAAAKKTADEGTLAKAKGVNLETALAGLTKAQTGISRTLADIQEELITKHSELAAVDEAISLKRQEMEALHGVNDVLLTIDEARVKHQETLQTMAKERQELVDHYAKLKADLEQTRQREAADFNYRRDQERKLDADNWQETRRAREVTERIRIEEFERDLDSRRSVLESQEAEYTAAIAKVATFDAQVDAEVKRQVAIVSNTMKKDADHVAKINEISWQAEKSNLARDNQHIAAQLAAANAEIVGLKEQLKAAYAAQTELAGKTVDAAASQKAQADALSLMTNIGAGGNGARPRG